MMRLDNSDYKNQETETLSSARNNNNNDMFLYCIDLHLSLQRYYWRLETVAFSVYTLYIYVYLSISRYPTCQTYDNNTIT